MKQAVLSRLCRDVFFPDKQWLFLLFADRRKKDISAKEWERKKEINKILKKKFDLSNFKKKH